MVEEQPNKPTKGTWDRLNTKDNTPKIAFEVNIPQTVEFLEDIPEEKESIESEGVYYVFRVKHEDQEKYFTTSAWTLLGALKELAPLKGKKVVIIKKLIKGKQTFEVSLV